MIRAVRFLPESQDDVDDIVRYFDHRSESVGDRFFAAVHKTVEMLRRHPEMGTVLRSALGKTTRLRTIIDFKKYLIFYRVENDTLLIVRVLHGSRDYSNLF